MEAINTGYLLSELILFHLSLSLSLSLTHSLSFSLSPLPSTQSYDSSDREVQGEWLVCFNSELELGRFEAALASTWREEFQIDLEFCEVTDDSVRHRAHRVVELMQSSKHRSDSMTRGRTEFT